MCSKRSGRWIKLFGILGVSALLLAVLIAPLPAVARPAARPPAQAGVVCGEALCTPVTAAYISHFTGIDCTGEEYYYTPYFFYDGVRRSWDGQGLAGTTLRTVTNRSWRGADGQCHNDWRDGNTLSDFVRIYRGTAQRLQLNLLYVHGVKNSTSDRLNADQTLQPLAATLDAQISAQILAYQSSHPGTIIDFHSAHANLYTAQPSPFHPSDSLGPVYMDDWEVGDPGCATTRQGDPCTTAYEWRYRLAREIERLFPPNAKNIIIIGHSTGGRVAMEVAANAGPDGVGTMNWGVQDKIAGVVTIHGMLDGLNDSKYNFFGIGNFMTICKNGDLVGALGGPAAPGDGWCEYAGNVSAFPAADWVANTKQALMLISYASCLPSIWGGYNDKALPFDAQASPAAVGMQMTPAPSKTWRVAHGVMYGSFCHSTITTPDDPRHSAAVSAATARIVEWLFERAPRTAQQDTITTPTLGYRATSAQYAVGGSCGAGNLDAGIEVNGLVKHPGQFDGDDHPVAAQELTIVDGPDCTGSFRWTQGHDLISKHAAQLTWKTYTFRSSTNVIGNLAPE
jgi:pimeloyl-ACP methyl ester carboxylesterase